MKSSARTWRHSAKAAWTAATVDTAVGDVDVVVAVAVATAVAVAVPGATPLRALNKSETGGSLLFLLLPVVRLGALYQDQAIPFFGHAFAFIQGRQ